MIQALQKYSRGQHRAVLENLYAPYRDLLFVDTNSTIVRLGNILEIRAEVGSIVARTKPEGVTDVRLVDDLENGGFLTRLGVKG